MNILKVDDVDIAWPSIVNTSTLFSLDAPSCKEITNFPVLVNTSFNCGGDPIVLDEQDAILSVLRMEINYLMIENILYEVKK